MSAIDPTGVVIWADGRLHGPTDALVSGVDHGLTVGDGVFETCGVVQGAAFALTRHLRRLAISARGLGLVPPDDGAVRTAVDEVLAFAPTAGRVRITFTAGPGPLGSNRDDDGDRPGTLVVLAGPATRADVGRVVRVPWVRNERSAVAGLKTTSYAENVVALAYAHRRGADEALLANTVGELCEGTGANVFVERGGELLTPHLTSGCLAGITRELLLEWGAAEGLPVREAEPGELRYDVLDDVAAGRAHLATTGSIRNVTPVVALDERAVPVGELCQAARDLFARRQALDVDP
ncbi:aminotransferase class IV [Cellulomonas composti]|uniref:4-amino-4-deoxychorismate lyase n=1 Tax=Cellulomonas composti TaxID=266130 RepID=A0A511J6R0_9CELL|nr:aminotransferase class IV [Cellulomonas composti]GEL93681.1 4-amino-4-deoxychorismate lyase [Cellulomonas composti]